MHIDEVKKYNRIVESIVGENAIESTQPTNTALSQYYAQLGKVYRRFHSEEGAMHFPIKFNEEQKHKEKLLFQAQTVEQIIKEKSNAKVLELGCGMAFNTIYLAKNNPNTSFEGIDLAASNIKVAKKNASKLGNVSFLEMDFDTIQQSEKKYDVIFAVETLCYSKDLICLLNILTTMLTDDGKIIIFDAYVNQKAADMIDAEERKAYNLLLWGWSLEKFDSMDKIMSATTEQSFKIEEMVNYSENIMSNNLAYQKGSMLAFGFSTILRILFSLKILPLSYIRQITAGLYSSYFVQNGYLGYYKLVVRKK